MCQVLCKSLKHCHFPGIIMRMNSILFYLCEVSLNGGHRLNSQLSLYRFTDSFLVHFCDVLSSNGEQLKYCHSQLHYITFQHGE